MASTSPHYSSDDEEHFSDSAPFVPRVESGSSSAMTSGQQTPEVSKGKKKVGWSLPSSDLEDEDGNEPRLDELRRMATIALPGANGPATDPTAAPEPKSKPHRGVLRNSGTSTPLPELSINNDADKRLSASDTAANHALHKAARLNKDISRSSSPTKSWERVRRKQSPFKRLFYHSPDELDSAMTSPEEDPDEDYVPRPSQWRIGALTAQMMTRGRHSRHGSAANSAASSAASSPQISPTPSQVELAGLVPNNTLARSARPRRPRMARSGSEETLTEKSHRPNFIRSASSSMIDLAKLIRPKSAPSVDPIIKDHIQDTVNRQKFIIKMCRALMLYGAPTHRIEEYMKATARVLETEAQFLYIPGCMIVSFDDSHTHTTEMKLVRVDQTVDLGRLRDTHDIYKEVIHDHIGVTEATERLEEIIIRDPQHSIRYRILMYGFASVCVGPFAFGARLIDLPLAFVLGVTVGSLQLWVSTKTDLYANIFEIVAVLVTSFLARWWGTLRHKELFCFPALAQSAIALILPGYTVLCGALELQAKSIIAGSVRLVYAIIYSLFLGFALTMGTAIYGVIDKEATSETVCRRPLSGEGYWIFFFVPAFAFCLMVINQAKYKQMPVMLVIAFVGYLVNFFTAKRFAGNAQVSSAVGSFAIAAMANAYSRISLDEVIKGLNRRFRKATGRTASPSTVEDSNSTPSTLESAAPTPTGWRMTLYRLRYYGAAPPGSSDSNPEKKHPRKSRITYSLAASAMLPAIFVQVPSGLSVSGSLVQGISTSDEIVRNATGSTLTAGDVYMKDFGSGNGSSSIAFTVGFSVIQVAIGITVGLFLGSLVIYPFGKTGKKRRSARGGLFSY